mmetsp:Transcript_131828/g.256807  ORF Transcript_131828/g.256807 Transcript_131828/m.256807 type:complete len:90 (-) Transcript_131828:92-361(-)
MTASCRPLMKCLTMSDVDSIVVGSPRLATEDDDTWSVALAQEVVKLCHNHAGKLRQAAANYQKLATCAARASNDSVLQAANEVSDDVRC